ncbi:MULTISPECIES: glycosyltransferase [unclassified Empedobacter]|uniref:glycosyltransferase n=1 Tax=unclassified Empedobacter TaxID=2643773 RepID=UPI00244C4DE4|nr:MULTISPECIES: glycosyltransferase [unclassified Empedobacter]MDH1603611.1 glycosyltransferase [Empedobacter sp. GD03739]MDH2206344.1 glycosyltransferase [Empedobacter sp. GD03644]
MIHSILYFIKTRLKFTYYILFKIRTVYRANYHKIVPYVYNDNKYKNHFLNNQLEIKNQENFVDKIDRVVYCFWTGNNEVTKNRVESLEILRNNLGVEVKLITISNLDNYILSDYPLHPAYQYLSLVHKSDYLRCYFMYHYGGGYSDIKRNNSNWQPIFESLEADPSKMIAGYPEFDPTKMGGKDLNKELNKDIFKYYKLCIGNCGFICKPYSPYVAEWYQELHKRLDYYHEELIKNPGIDRGFNKGYPIEWFEILSRIMVPLSLKYHNQIIYDKRLMPNFDDYL